MGDHGEEMLIMSKDKTASLLVDPSFYFIIAREE